MVFEPCFAKTVLDDGGGAAIMFVACTMSRV